MEMFELKYFLGAAHTQNLQRASEKLGVSPASLSKAIGRLEQELGVSLFSREGRNIRITDHGLLLQKKASEILGLEEDARLTIGGHKGSIRAVIAGPEVLLAEMGIAKCLELAVKFPRFSFEFQHGEEERALALVASGEAHLAVITGEVPGTLVSKVIAQTGFQTYCGKGHPLFESAKNKKTVPIEEILRHPFASPSHSFLGQVGGKASLDGWRDDKFPRQVGFLTSSLKLLEEIALRGKALVYLPDYYGARLGLSMLKISGCPYGCTQKVKLVARSPKDLGWLSRLF
jgi:DNA-binding transcriptional LysR family regulator